MDYTARRGKPGGELYPSLTRFEAREEGVDAFPQTAAVDANSAQITEAQQRVVWPSGVSSAISLWVKRRPPTTAIQAQNPPDR